MIPEVCKTEKELIDLCNEQPQWLNWIVKQVEHNPKNPNIKLYQKVLKKMVNHTNKILEEANA